MTRTGNVGPLVHISMNKFSRQVWICHNPSQAWLVLRWKTLLFYSGNLGMRSPAAVTGPCSCICLTRYFNKYLCNNKKVRLQLVQPNEIVHINWNYFFLNSKTIGDVVYKYKILDISLIYLFEQGKRMFVSLRTVVIWMQTAHRMWLCWRKYVTEGWALEF